MVRHALFFIYLSVIGLLALLGQMVLPQIFPLMGKLGLGSAFIPLLVIYASLEMGDERAPYLAGLLGLLLDLFSSHRLGTSVLVLSSLSLLILTQAHKAESHTWYAHLLFAMIGTFLFLTLDYTFILVQDSRWTWPLAVWNKITFAALFNLIVSPLFFSLLNILPRQCGWELGSDTALRRYVYR